jgi:hypothetical protein
MSHGFYSQPPYQQYPPQPYAQPQQYPAGHSPQAATPTPGYFPTHTRAASEFGANQSYAQPPYPAQPYTPYGQQPQPPQQPPFSPFTQPPAAGYQPPPAGYQAPVAAHQSPQPSNPPRIQHQHSHSVPAAYPATTSAYSAYASPNQQSPHAQPSQQMSYNAPPAAAPVAQDSFAARRQFSHLSDRTRPDSMPPPARSATLASSYATRKLSLGLMLSVS